jgi:hypothetical protein
VSLLKTYAPPTPIVPLERVTYDGPLMPGDWVRHSEYGGCGIIVAIDAENMTVLWSREPITQDYLFYAPYIPLQVTPSIFLDKPDFSIKSILPSCIRKRCLSLFKIEGIK